MDQKGIKKVSRFIQQGSKKMTRHIFSLAPDSLYTETNAEKELFTMENEP